LIFISEAVSMIPPAVLFTLVGAACAVICRDSP
jgi:hypothetical protein